MDLITKCERELIIGGTWPAHPPVADLQKDAYSVTSLVREVECSEMTSQQFR